jgi:hypothetical protein
MGLGRRVAHHLVYCFHDLQHLFVADLAIAVDIVELKGPIQLVLHLASAGDAQGADKLLEIDGAAVIRIENFEDMIGE